MGCRLHEVFLAGAFNNVRAVEVLHDLLKIRVGGFDEDMVMVGYEAGSMDDGPIPFMGLTEILKESLSVPLAL